MSVLCQVRHEICSDGVLLAIDPAAISVGGEQGCDMKAMPAGTQGNFGRPRSGIISRDLGRAVGHAAWSLVRGDDRHRAA
jgi:hypothetical protein